MVDQYEAGKLSLSTKTIRSCDAGVFGEDTIPKPDGLGNRNRCKNARQLSNNIAWHSALFDCCLKPVPVQDHRIVDENAISESAINCPEPPMSAQTCLGTCIGLVSPIKNCAYAYRR